MKNHKYTISILLAGALWGFMGLFRRTMGDMGVSSGGLIILRCGIAALCFALTLLIRDRAAFRVRLRDLWCFLGSGIVSLLLFSYCYFQAMNYMSLSAAAILLYTAPSIVMVFSVFLFHEKFTGKKLAALVMAFVGCALVSGIGGASITGTGLLYGLGAGFGYAMYSVFARCALDRGYSSLCVNFYSCLFAALGALALFGTEGSVDVMLGSGGNAAFCLLAGVVTCYLPYLLYTFGLGGMETGRASIMASVEPVVATLVGVFIFKESLNAESLAGVALVLGAIVVLNLAPKKPAQVQK